MQKPSTVFMFVPWKTVYCFSVYCWLKPIFPDLQITAILVTNTAQHQKLVFSLISNTTTTISSDEPSLPLLTSSLSPARRIAIMQPLPTTQSHLGVLCINLTLLGSFCLLCWIYYNQPTCFSTIYSYLTWISSLFYRIPECLISLGYINSACHGGQDSISLET